MSVESLCTGLTGYGVWRELPAVLAESGVAPDPRSMGSRSNPEEKPGS